MNTADWIAAAIAIPAVSAIILLLKQVVTDSNARQTKITDAFVAHVEKQTETLGNISSVLEQVIAKEDAQCVLVEALTHELTKNLQAQTKATIADHKKIWKTISSLIDEIKQARLTRTEEAHTRGLEAEARSREAAG